LKLPLAQDSNALSGAGLLPCALLLLISPLFKKLEDKNIGYSFFVDHVIIALPYNQKNRSSSNEGHRAGALRLRAEWQLIYLAFCH